MVKATAAATTAESAPTSTHRTHDATTFDDVLQETMQRIVLSNNLASLKPNERMEYYSGVCKSLRLNPLTKPFEYLELPDRERGKDQNGNTATKLVLYATKSCTDQLRMIYGITVTVTDKAFTNGLYVVTAKARTPDAREDEDIGAVPIEKEGGEWQTAQSGKRFFKGNGKMTPVTGDALANSLMKAITKAKRRVTLSICGLGMLDESEIESIVGSKPVTGDTEPAATNGDDAAQVNPFAWVEAYAKEVEIATDEDGLKLAEFNARGHFDKLTQAERDGVKFRLIAIKGQKEQKLSSFKKPADDEAAVKVRRAIIDQLVEQFGQERFLEATHAAGLRGDSEGWSIEKLNECKQKLESEPW